MSQNAVKRLYLMQVGSMPEYQVPIVCYLVQTDDGKNILIVAASRRSSRKMNGLR